VDGQRARLRQAGREQRRETGRLRLAAIARPSPRPLPVLAAPQPLTAKRKRPLDGARLVEPNEAAGLSRRTPCNDVNSQSARNLARLRMNDESEHHADRLGPERRGDAARLRLNFWTSPG